MKIAEAKQKLMELAKGSFHSLEYTIDDHGEGRVSQKCRVYIDTHGFFEGPQWEVALAQLETALSGKSLLSEDVPTSTKNQKG